MAVQILVKKATGEMVPFSEQKLINSLKRAGADDNLIGIVVDDIVSRTKNGDSTRLIYKLAFSLLRKHTRSMAARYSLKNSIMDLGPSGYPFEFFIGEVFKSQGFSVLVGQEVEGFCVKHEVDVIATNNGNQHLVECKFYNSQGKYANVQVPLYIRSRVNDIIKKRENLDEFKNLTFHGWVVTNTRFTSDALTYGVCSGLNMLSWDYPKDKNIKSIVEEKGLFPVTVLTQLSKADKEKLLSKGSVLCRQLHDNNQLLDVLLLKDNKKRRLLEELEDLCSW